MRWFSSFLKKGSPGVSSTARARGGLSAGVGVVVDVAFHVRSPQGRTVECPGGRLTARSGVPISNSYAVRCVPAFGRLAHCCITCGSVIIHFPGGPSAKVRALEVETLLKVHVRPSSSAVLSYLQAVPRALQVISHSSQFRSHMHGCCCATPNQIRCPVSRPTLWQA